MASYRDVMVLAAEGWFRLVVLVEGVEDCALCQDIEHTYPRVPLRRQCRWSCHWYTTGGPLCPIL